MPSLFLTGHVSDLWPYVRAQALEENPQLSCMDDLRRVADLRQPPNWYPEARALVRKVIFHAGTAANAFVEHRELLKERKALTKCPLFALVHVLASCS